MANLHRAHRRSILASIVGVVLAVIGAILGAGGAWLLALGGSPYYLVAGLGLLVSGVLVVIGRPAGLWLYALVFALTVPWALWESGADPWALVPRLVGPALLLALVALIAPLIDPRTGWLRAIVGAVVAIAFTGAVIFSAAALAPQKPVGPFPSASNANPVGVVGNEWVAYGGNTQATRYSGLNQINTGNVGKLRRAWVSHVGDFPADPMKAKYAWENTPLEIGNRLFLCSPHDKLMALDAATGQKIWEYDPQVPEKAVPYSASCRGVTAWRVPGAAAGTPCAMRIFEGTLDARLIAVDAETGKPCQDFGTNGAVDTTVGMGRVYPGMAAMTAPPVVVNGVLISGRQVMDGQRNDAPSGVILGHDAKTGAFKWAWDLGRPGQTGMPGPGQVFTRGTPNMWTAATGDDQLNMVYLPMGNSASDYWSSDRSPQENQYSSSLVALNASTGQPVWHFQTVHKDVWDYDLGSQVTLVDLPNGTPALVLPSKQGQIYVLDRRTGKPLHGVVEKPVPTTGQEPAQRSPTQPYSQFADLNKPDLRERDMWGMSPIDQLACRIQFRKAVYHGQFTPPVASRHSIEYPSYNGGSDWGSVAVDPVRGVIYANYNDMPNYVELVPRAVADAKGWKARGPQGYQEDGGGSPEGAGDPQVGVPYAIDVNAGWKLKFTGMLCKEPPYGWVRAIDLATGRTIWDRPFGTAERNGPFGIPSMLPFTIGLPNNGGSVVTAGGLMFVAATTDNKIRAIDTRTGKTVWSDTLPGGGQANVMTYSVGGRQYVVVTAGGHHFMKTPMSDAVVAYALPS